MTRPSTCGDCGALGGTRTPNLLIRRSGHIVQGRPSRLVCWADIPPLSASVGCCLAAWQQCWQQTARARMMELNRISSAGQGVPIGSSWISAPLGPRRTLPDCGELQPKLQPANFPVIVPRLAGDGLRRSGRLGPGPWFLTGVSAEAPVSSVTSRVR
jgi:hypothetical protein